jgi:hypothetical protein
MRILGRGTVRRQVCGIMEYPPGAGVCPELRATQSAAENSVPWTIPADFPRTHLRTCLIGQIVLPGFDPGTTKTKTRDRDEFVNFTLGIVRHRHQKSVP